MNEIQTISNWIKDYATKAKKTTLVVGVSGGIDSAVVSTLCAKTGLKTIPMVMSIGNKDILGLEHAWWLDENFPNISRRIINMEKIFHEFEKASMYINAANKLAFANTKARLRMTMLYQMAQSENGLVVGTGNKVEDFGVGFYTKYGDGGVDISPIADFYKSEVRQMGVELGVLEKIIEAKPTDGLWEDGRTDEDQLGMSYEEIEKAMKQDETHTIVTIKKDINKLNTYREIRKANLHKMVPIPVYRRK
tara:strand:+ start:44883 stop:45629 length:747 start_codon:yes stop_codon:yes gene_type:complete